jgi:hypothetical protein
MVSVFLCFLLKRFRPRRRRTPSRRRRRRRQVFAVLFVDNFVVTRIWDYFEKIGELRRFSRLSPKLVVVVVAVVRVDRSHSLSQG